MTPRRRLGDFGERVAAHRLESLGMRIIGRNIRQGRIEIDLLAEDGDDLVFCEVRTRRGSPGLAAESLSPAKVGRMWRAALDYCEQAAIDPARARLDAVVVDLDGRGQAHVIEHLRAIEVPDEAD